MIYLFVVSFISTYFLWVLTIHALNRIAYAVEWRKGTALTTSNDRVWAWVGQFATAIAVGIALAWIVESIVKASAHR